MGLYPQIWKGKHSPVHDEDVTIMLHNAHHEIKAWGHVHARENSNETI